jgi:putative transposase
MPRRARSATGGFVYHVLNRANARACLFENDGDYQAFERVLLEAHDRLPMRTLAYAVMPNHWHLILWPQCDRDMPNFMHWLTVTHAQRWHAHHGTAGMGHLYQGRYKSFPVQTDAHFLTVCRYVERNALRANLVQKAEEWRWSSLWRREHGGADAVAWLSEWPTARPKEWAHEVNMPLTQQELDDMRHSIARSCPYGDSAWVERAAHFLCLEHTLRGRGRPQRRG